MANLIEELNELKATLKADGYKDWCYAQLTIDKAIAAVKNCNIQPVAKSLPEYNEILYHARTLTDEQFREYWDEVQGNDANRGLCAADLKEELVNYLKTKNIDDITSLWAYSKDFYKKQLREMGGSYASWGKKISVSLNNSINNSPIRFDVALDEVR